MLQSLGFISASKKHLKAVILWVLKKKKNKTGASKKKKKSLWYYMDLDKDAWVEVTLNPFSIIALHIIRRYFRTPLPVAHTGSMHPFPETRDVAIHQLRNIWKRVVFLRRRMAKESMWLSERNTLLLLKNPVHKMFLVWHLAFELSHVVQCCSYWNHTDCLHPLVSK